MNGILNMPKKHTMKEINKINKELEKNNMLQVKVVNPKECIGQKVNARYFPAEKMHRLTTNVKNSGHLESVPLIYEEDNKIHIISGHHRIEAAKEAGLKKILVMVAKPEDKDDIISKQLAHNELVGVDDSTILAELFDSIKDISKRIASGLDDSVSNIQYTSLNFRIGNFKEFTVMFLPEDIDDYDNTMNEITEKMLTKSQSEIRLSSIKYYDNFAKTIRKIKKVENIKSNGVALMRLIEIANNVIEENTQNAHT